MKRSKRRLTEKYIRSVSRHIDCSSDAKLPGLDRLRADVNSFVDSHPGCTFDDVVAEFGDPEIAASGIEDMIPKGPASVKAKNRSRVYYIIMIVMAILTIVFIVGYTLAKQEPPDPKYKDHELAGEYTGCRECHITPYRLLIYEVIDSEPVLYLTRTGTHSDLF